MVARARLEVVGAAANLAVDDIPSKLDLLVNNKVYLADAAPEKEYVGLLKKKKGTDAVGYALVIERRCRRSAGLAFLR